MSAAIAWAATAAAALLLVWSLYEGDRWREHGWAICSGAPSLRDRGAAARRALHRMMFGASALPLLLGLAVTHDVTAPRTWLAAVLALLVMHGLTIAATIDEGAAEIPDAVTMPLLAFALLAGGSGALDGTLVAPRASLLGAGAGLALGGLVPALYGRGMNAVGGADLLLLAAIGAMVGVLGLATTVLAAGVVTVLGRGLLQRSDGALPYAPGLAIGFGVGAAVASLVNSNFGT